MPLYIIEYYNQFKLNIVPFFLTLLFLGAGGPLGGLEAGALIALDEKGVKFDIISGACIGSVISLAYSSPANGMTGREALEMWCNTTGISDEIYYGFCPTNYKVFQKNAGILNPINDFWIKEMVRLNPLYSVNPKNQFERFYSDMYLYCLTLCTTSFPFPGETSISRIAPFLENFINFNEIKNVELDVYINAMNITDKEIAVFDKEQITEKQVIAGSSLFFICPQTMIDGKLYGEGSYRASLNYQSLIKDYDQIETIIVMNILNKNDLIRKPRNQHDAYNLSIMLPFITIAEDDTKLFKAAHENNQNIHKIEFEIPKGHEDKALDWSVSNFKTLRDIGYKASLEFYNNNKNLFN